MTGSGTKGFSAVNSGSHPQQEPNWTYCTVLLRLRDTETGNLFKADTLQSCWTVCLFTDFLPLPCNFITHNTGFHHLALN